MATRTGPFEAIAEPNRFAFDGKTDPPSSSHPLGTFPALAGGDYNIEWAFSPGSAPKELQEWLQHSDPVALFVQTLMNGAAMSHSDIAAIDSDVRKAADAAVQFALQSPAPKAEAALEHVFA